MKNSSSVLLWIISIALTATATYWLTSSSAGMSGDAYLKKSDLQTAMNQYFSEHPDVVYEAVVKGMRNKEAAEQAHKQKMVLGKKNELENDPSTPFAGNPKGDVKIVMFTDYNCGYCRHSVPVITKLLAKDPNIKFVTKEYPILGPGSLLAAKAAIAVFAIDKSKYFAFYQKMFDTEIRSEGDIIEAARSVGISEARLIEEMKKPANGKALQRIRTLGTELGINGTPAFIIDGEIYTGALSEKQLSAIIQKVRKKQGS